jgi:hypothetical protein
VFFGAKSKRVHVDVFVGDSGVVLVGLYQTEVSLGASLESVVSVEEDLGVSHEIDSVGGDRGSGVRGGKVEPVVVASSALSVNVSLENPDKFFDGVVKVQTEFVVGRSSEDDGFRSVELNLVDEVFV